MAGFVFSLQYYDRDTAVHIVKILYPFTLTIVYEALLMCRLIPTLTCHIFQLSRA